MSAFSGMANFRPPEPPFVASAYRWVAQRLLLGGALMAALDPERTLPIAKAV